MQSSHESDANLQNHNVQDHQAAAANLEQSAVRIIFVIVMFREMYTVCNAIVFRQIFFFGFINSST